jgi:hypothetical protein
MFQGGALRTLERCHPICLNFGGAPYFVRMRIPRF